jgi:hypothetical protein
MDDLSNQLEIYKENYARYRVSGDLSAKAVADSALAAADAIILHQQELYNGDKHYIQSFIQKFRDSEPELTNLHERASVLEKQIPRVQNEYVQTQMMNESPIAAHVDYTPYLIKAGVVVGLAVVAGLAATL